MSNARLIESNRMGVVAFAALSIFTLLTSSVGAQTNAPHISPGRFLFIVETSSGMRRCAPGTQKTVSNLLLSSMHAQLRPGDSIGVWTYDDQLHAGHLPLQHWTPANEERVATNVLAFLKAQKYEKKPHLDRVWPALRSVVKESDKLTVLLISAGDEPISGTPFDGQINQFFKARFRDQQKARMPFVIVLRSRRGQFISTTLNLGQWPVEFSPFPPEPKVAAKPKPKPPETKPAPRPTAPPLIVIGKKPEPPPEPVTPPPADETQPATPGNPSVASALLPQPKSENSSVTATPFTKSGVEAIPSASEPAKPVPSEVVPTPASPPSQSKVELSPIPAAPPPKPDVESPNLQSTPMVAAADTKPGSPHIVTQPSVGADVATSPAAGLVQPEQELKPESGPPPATIERSTTNLPGQVATAIAPEKILVPAILVVTGVGLLVLAGAIFFLIRRRAHADAHASLITRSMDQHKP